MSRSLEETLVAFAEKYQGDFKEIFKAVAYKERLTDNEIDKLNDNVDEKYVTVMSEDYPEVLKGIDCPPIVMFYEGNMDLVSEEVYEIASPLDKSKRVFFKLDITNDGMDYFIECENSHDLVKLIDFFIDQSYHALIKREWLNRFKITNYEHAYRLVFEYIEGFYNTIRVYSHCDYKSPNEYEQDYLISNN